MELNNRLRPEICLQALLRSFLFKRLIFRSASSDGSEGHFRSSEETVKLTELKRFGRNYSEIYKEWFHITKELECDIRVTSMPLLDTTQYKELIGQLITDVVLSVFAYVAEEDWRERHELQAQGIKAAKAAGRNFERPQIAYPEQWSEVYGKWRAGDFSAREAMEHTGLKKDSFYRLVKKFESQVDHEKMPQEEENSMKQGKLFFDVKTERYSFVYRDEDGDLRDYGVSIAGRCSSFI